VRPRRPKRKTPPPSAAARFLLVAILCSACAHAGVLDRRIAARALLGTDGAVHEVPSVAATRLTVIFFFSNHCPCQAAHDDRIRYLYALYLSRGVDMLAVDSEIGATASRDATEAATRRYPFPILIDAGGALARSVGAQYATEAFVVDRGAVVRYHGGIDSDRKALHDDATPFLRDALDDLLADRAPRRAEGKALGCALQTW
jgi:hypothetical protein